MHKGVILLTKATSRKEAEDNINEFLEPYGDGDVWDWYSIGNRWHNALAPKDKVTQFDKWLKETYKHVFQGHGYAVDDLENDKVRPVIQAKWEELGLKGKNTYYSAYGFGVEDTDNDYNIIPLADCIDTVTEWKRDMEVAKKEAWDKMVTAKAEHEISGKYDASAYYAGIYRDIANGSFSFECNVYNVETLIPEDVPEDITGYWAVMVDLHN